MRAFEPKSVKSFTLSIFAVALSVFGLASLYILLELRKTEGASETYTRLLEQPRNAAGKIREIFQTAIQDLNSIDVSALLASQGTSVLQKRGIVWERTRLDHKGEWAEAHLSIPIYRELSVEEIASGNCVPKKIFRSDAGRDYTPQSERVRLFPFDGVCEYLTANPKATYVSSLLAWFTPKTAQLSKGAEDPVDSKSPVTYIDGIYRVARRVTFDGKVFLISLAIDSRHIQDRAIHMLPFPEPEVVFPSYHISNYTQVSDRDGVTIVHNKFWNFPGFDRKTGRAVPLWDGKGEQLLPVRYPEFAQYPPKVGDLYSPEGRPDGITINSYHGKINNQTKSQIHAPIYLNLPGVETPYFFGVVSIGLKTIDFIERATAFNRASTEMFRQTAFVIVLGLIFSSVLFLAISYFWWQRFSAPLLRLSREIVRIKGGKETHLDIDGMSRELSEFQLLARVINELLKHIRGQSRELLSRSLEERSITAASQVLHDIRSPLVALDMVSQRSQEMPEDLRVLLRQSIERIQHLVDDLKRQQARGNQRQWDGAITPLDVVIEEILLEKKNEYQNRKEVTLRARFTDSEFGLFSSFPVAELRRILSNVLNNAFEAIDGSGSIEIFLEATANDVVVRIEDTGRGIPSHVLPRLVEKGFSFNKIQGTGLGLFHAKEALERNGGSISISSQVGEGTAITLNLPRHSPPTWFPNRLNVPERSTVVVVDDDPSIHAVWRNRLSGERKTEHFLNPADFIAWLSNGVCRENCLFLVDYEFSNAAETGLDLIETLGLQAQSVLVTFRYAEADVQKRAESLGIAILPKNLAIRIPLRTGRCPAESPSVVLIDNDPLVRQVWKKSAEEKGIAFRSYAGYLDFDRDRANISTESSIYVDFHLGATDDGVVIAGLLKRQGFANVVITSGDARPTDYSEEWIGKGPPWSSPPLEETVRSTLKIAHDLRPVLLALGVSIDQLSEIPDAEREFLEETRERLHRIIVELDRR